MKTISETIDGSIKNIIQLKTVDNSLEYSQMFDALEECPEGFKSKLIGALNSLGETMGTDPCDAFNKVLCASDDENAKKKLYNWWTAVFEVVGKSTANIPEDRKGEYDEKVDALIAEICKAGDKASDSNEVVLEDFEQVKEDYEPADLEDEDKFNQSMQFAISKLGEVAKKVQDLVNFLNPYCNTNESNEVNNMKKLNERGDSDWVSMDDIVGMEVGESDLENELEIGDDGWKEIGQPIGETDDGGEFLGESDFLDKMMEDAENTDDMFEVYDGNVVEDGSVCLNVIVHKDDTDKSEVEAEFKDMPTKYGWKYDHFAFSSDAAGEEGTENITVYFRPSATKVDEATVEVDANDVWDVLDLLDDENANKNLTDLINSHVRTEDEIMDAIDSLFTDNVTKAELNKFFVDPYALVTTLGLDGEKYKTNGQFVDPEKPVALEGSEDGNQKLDEVKDGEKKYKQDGETKTLVTDKKIVSEMTIEQDVNDPWKLVNLLWGQGKDNFQELLDSNLFSDDRIMDTLEQFEIRELGNLNDFLAFQFEDFLEALGCDREAWVQNLEITRGGSEEVDEASKKKAAPKDPMIAKIEETIPVDAKDGLIEIRPDRFNSYLAVYAPGSEPEMVAATQALSKAFPDYYVGYDNNSVAIWPKKRV